MTSTSRWFHNWKSAQVVNSHLVCDPTIRQPGFDLLGNSGLCWTVFARKRDTAVPAEGNGDLQTLICVLVTRPRQCLTQSNPVPWQNWMAAYLGYTLRTKTLFRGWRVMVHDTHMRRRINVEPRERGFIKCLQEVHKTPNDAQKTTMTIVAVTAELQSLHV